MINYYRTRAFILGKSDAGEADRYFIALTEEFGKLRIFGKAARKIKSKLRHALETFYLSEIEFIQGKTRKTITDATLLDNFPIIRGNLKKLEVAYRIADVLDRFLGGEQKDEKVWLFVSKAFSRLNSLSLEARELFFLYYYFLWNFLDILGYKLRLRNCVRCQKKLVPEKLYFSPSEGGIICQSCLKKDREGAEKELQEISLDVVKVLRLVLEKKWPTLMRLKLRPSHRNELRKVSFSYLEHIPERSKI